MTNEQKLDSACKLISKKMRATFKRSLLHRRQHYIEHRRDDRLGRGHDGDRRQLLGGGGELPGREPGTADQGCRCVVLPVVI